jgi:hypothetical protein
MNMPMNVPAIKVVDAHGLQNKKRSKASAACDAADLVDGLAKLQNPTIRIAALAYGVSQSYVAAALRLSPLQRSAVRNGWQPLLPHFMPGPKPDPKKKLAEVVAEIGVDRTLTLLAANEKPHIAA